MKAPEFWYCRSGRDAAPLIRSLLKPLSMLYHWETKRRLRKAISFQAGLPVICVGNAVLGGTGKTPVVAALCAMLKTGFQRNPCILMRGYKGSLLGPVFVDPNVHHTKEVGDEALLLTQVREKTGEIKEKQAVCIAKDRKAGAWQIMNSISPVKGGEDLLARVEKKTTSRVEKKTTSRVSLQKKVKNVEEKRIASTLSRQQGSVTENLEVGQQYLSTEPRSKSRFDLIVMDDGLQNPSLVKNLTFLVLDGERGLGNGRVFPAGPLREPFAEALERTDIVIIMVPDFSFSSDFLKSFQIEWAESLKTVSVFTARLVSQEIAGGESLSSPRDKNSFPPDQKRVSGQQTASEERQTHSRQQISSGRWLAFAGIGRPEKFFESLRSLKMDLCQFMPFPDHHDYTGKEIKKLYLLAAGEKAKLITTEKDWVRLDQEDQKRIAYLPVKVEFETEDLLRKEIKDFLASSTGER